MKKFDVVQYMLPVPTGEFENVVRPDTEHIVHRQPKYGHAPVYAIVIGIHEQDIEEPLVDLAFLHPSRVSALSGADWRDAFDRVFGVRHISHDDVEQGNFAMGHYREIPNQEEVKKFIDDYNRAFSQKSDEVHALNAKIIALEAELASTTEGKDKALQALADERARVSSTPTPSQEQASGQ